MKRLKKIVSITLALIVSIFVFSGCSTKTLLKRAGKNLTTYSIDAVFCDTEKKVSAIETVKFINNTGEVLETVCFNLYGKAFSDKATIKPYSKSKMLDCFPNGVNYGDMLVNSLLVDGVNKEVVYVGEDGNALEVSLNEPLNPEESVEITIDFELYLANCTHRLGFNAGKVNLGNWYPIVAVYANGEFDVAPYYANGDPFFSDCANYEVSISYADYYTLSSTGNHQNTNTESGVKRSVYKATAVRDFAMVMLSDVQIKEIEVEETLISVLTKSGDANIDVYLETARRSVVLFNNLFGRYPYNTLNVVFTDFFQGGMEYPNLVYISTSVTELEEIKKVIIHEIAHQWWYGLVGNDEVSVAWFDEGLAEYSTLLYYENYSDEAVDPRKLVEDTKISYELYIDVIKSLKIEINYGMELELDEYSTEYEYVYMIYVKGLLFFDSLRTTLGNDMFFKCLNEIFNEYEFKHITKEKFIEVVKKTAGVDVTEFVEGWLSGNTDISQF